MSRLTVRASAALVLACAGIAIAGVDTSADKSALTLDTPIYAQAAAPAPRKPLMMGLDKLGLAKPLDDAGINIYGFVEASFTYSASSPPANFISGRVFDTDHEDITLNQLDLTIQKTVDASKGKFDVGFTVETIYGGDARFIHGNGADFYGPGSFQQYPDEQIDIVQAYADIAIPIGSGVRLVAGKMVTHMGYETINPTTDPLYSHSYLFGYAIPFTHTGFMAYYSLNDKLSIMGGMSRGWNQELKDNNGDGFDVLGQVSYKVSDKTQFIFNFTVGPEAANDNGNWWWVGDAILTQTISDQLSIAVNADWGYYEHGSLNGSASQWYGIAAYAKYKISDMFTINARGEWYDDTDGFTMTGTPNVVYEATLGVAITPMPNDDIGKNLLIRPEIRYDYAQEAFFDGGTDHSQFTAAVDAIFTF